MLPKFSGPQFGLQKPHRHEPDYEEIGPSLPKKMNGEQQRSFHCDLCGSMEGVVRCMKCSNQVFCLACDEMYHRHPKRASHDRKAVESLAGPQGMLVRPPVYPKIDSNAPAPLPPPRKNKRFQGEIGGKRRASVGGMHVGVKPDGGINRSFAGDRPLPLPPDKNRGSLYKAGSTGNLTQHNSQYTDDPGIESMQVAIPQPIVEINQMPSSRGSLPPPGHQPGRLQHKAAHMGHSRKLSLQQFPPPSASMADPPQQNGNWDSPPKIPQKMRSQSISDDQWNKAVIMPGNQHGYHGSSAASETGGSSRSYHTVGSNGRPLRYPGMSSSTSVNDLSVMPHPYHGMQPANSFQQLAMMGYDPNMMWMPCPMCPIPMYPHGMSSAGMKRATSNVSMNMSSASEASGYPWSAPGHVHQHHMPMYPPNYYHGHPHMMAHPSMRGSSGSIPESVNSYNMRNAPPIPQRPSSRRSHKSSRSRTDTNGNRSRGHSRRPSMDSDCRLSSGSDDIKELDLKTKKPGSLSWQCDHCTFINPGHAKACGMCSKSVENQPMKDILQRKTQKSSNRNDNEHIKEDEISDYDNDKHSSRRSNKESLSRRPSAARSIGSRSGIRSQPKYTSGSDSASTGNKHDIERQFESLRIGSSSRTSGFDGGSVSSHTRKSNHPMREEGRKSYRKKSVSQSLRSRTPIRYSPERSFTSSDDMEPSFSESSRGSDDKSLSPDPRLIRRGASRQRSLKSRDKLREDRQKRLSGISTTSSGRRYREDGFDEHSNESPQPTSEDILDEPTMENILRETDTRLTASEKDIVRNLNISDFEGSEDDVFIEDHPIKETIEIIPLKKEVSIDNKESAPRKSSVTRPVSSHYEMVEKPLKPKDLELLKDTSHTTRSSIKDESYYTAAELDQTYEEESKSRQKIFDGRQQKRPSAAFIERQQSPLSISSSEAIFYSPPDTPNILEKLPGTAMVQTDENERIQKFQQIDSTFQSPKGKLRKSASDQNVPQGQRGRLELSADEKNLTIDELVAKRRQETMKEQGLEVVQLLRDAEHVGYNPDEVSIAMTLSGGMNPLEWLKENWKHMVNTVMTLATNYSRQHAAVTSPNVTDAEAVEALRLHKGNIWAAVSECVDQRQESNEPQEIKKNHAEGENQDVKQKADNSEDSQDNIGKVQRIGSFLKQMWKNPQNQQMKSSSPDSPASSEVKEVSEGLYGDVEMKPTFIGESFYQSTSVSDDLKKKIMMTMKNPNVQKPSTQHIDSDQESTIEELLGVSENPSFYDYFTAVDLEEYSEEDLESIDEDQENFEEESRLTVSSGGSESNGMVTPQETKKPLDSKPTASMPTTSGTEIKILPKYKPKTSKLDKVTISRWKSREFRETENSNKSEEENIVTSDHVVKGSLMVKKSDAKPRAVEIGIKKESDPGVTTGRLSLSLAPSPSTEPESEKTPVQDDLETKTLDKQVSSQEVSAVTETVDGIRIVKKATKVVGLAISKAMARESTVKESANRNSASSASSSMIGSPIPPSSTSEQDEEKPSIDDEPNQAELETPIIPSEDETKSSNEVLASAASAAQIRRSVILPAVASYSGPIFIPSKSPGTRIPLETAKQKRSRPSSFISKSPTPESTIPPELKSKSEETSSKVPPPFTGGGQPTPLRSSKSPPVSSPKIEVAGSRSVVLSKSTDGGSTMVSPSDSDEDLPHHEVPEEKAGVTDSDFDEVKKLEEQINQMRKEIQERMSPTEDASDNPPADDHQNVSGRESESSSNAGDPPEEPMTMEQREQYDQLKFDRTVRRLLAEGQAETYEKAELAAQLVSMSFAEEDSVHAAAECSSIYTAMRFLRQECELCTEPFPMGKMVSMLHCTHRCCNQCAINYFTFQIKAKNIRELRCPFCNEPDLNSNEEVAMEYFNHLDILLKGIIDTETHELFQRKVRDFTLMKDPNFRWCNRCSSGFIANARARKHFCPDCQEVTCATCRSVWEPQHEGISCEEFKKWKDENDPESQAMGVARHLAECGIKCPQCKFTYALAKGGCMHFTCTECKFEFCSGCNKPFKQGGRCTVGPYCERLGLHAHHPRNCLFYLRDKEPEHLQKLLTEHKIPFDTEAPYEAVSKSGTAASCRVMEQKELANGILSDDFCGRTVTDGHAGLCNLHYTEYLVERINSSDLDPVTIFDEADLRVCLRRNGKTVPVRRWESEKLYREKLIKQIKEQLPLS